MKYQLNVYALPTLVAPEELSGSTAVVIDILRASTTMIYALEAGAQEIVPCLEVEEAREAAAGFPPGEAVLGGERKGMLIEGFDLANSPTEYTPASVGGRTVVFTTTNGTRALLRCRQAADVYIGAFVNATAVARRILGQEQIHLVCAGTAGQYSRDDVLFAGLLVDRIQRLAGLPYQLNAQALTARENWVSSFSVPFSTGAEPLGPDVLAAELRKSIAGRNLISIGCDDDILAAAEIDRFSTVPELDKESFRVRLP
ncbi:MAG: 2-phosphosulfolactate phosphatase [Pirellulales bacterium]|nr:2-phosphosulfolactate phosphatase [Pirellulales bacterium]